MKLRWIAILFFLGSALLIFSAFLWKLPSHDEFLEKRAELVVRQIGHKVLQYSGDSTSRVFPVKHLNASTFQLEFQNQFSFMPDTLVKIVRTHLGQLGLPTDYMVNVFDCISNEVVYGFEVRPDHKEIIPCLKRAQPKGCYVIQISFVNLSSEQRSNAYYPVSISAFLGLTLIAFIGRYYFKKKKEETSLPAVYGISIGKYSFSLDDQTLRSETEVIELSEKEAKVLSILASRQNELISRDELLKKVWEDEGVFTGRSLDMFISRVRKKLKNDPGLQITNVHGKGYKLEVAGRS